IWLDKDECLCIIGLTQYWKKSGISDAGVRSPYNDCAASARHGRRRASQVHAWFPAHLRWPAGPTAQERRASDGVPRATGPTVAASLRGRNALARFARGTIKCLAPDRSLAPTAPGPPPDRPARQY